MQNFMNKEFEELLKERLEKRNMTTGQVLAEENARRDFVEKNKLLFFLMVKGLTEEYIEFCSFDKLDWDAYFGDLVRM